MASVFTRILRGDLPGHIVWQDDTCFALLPLDAMHPAHVLVIPVQEVDQFTQLPADAARALWDVVQRLSVALHGVAGAARIGLMVQGFEVPHVHVHLVPIDSPRDLDFARARRLPDADRTAMAATLRAAFAGA